MYGKITPTVTAVPVAHTLLLSCHTFTKPVWRFKKRTIREAVFVDNMMIILMVKKKQMGEYSCYGTDMSGVSFHALAYVFVGGKNATFMS